MVKKENNQKFIIALIFLVLVGVAIFLGVTQSVLTNIGNEISGRGITNEVKILDWRGSQDLQAQSSYFGSLASDDGFAICGVSDPGITLSNSLIVENERTLVFSSKLENVDRVCSGNNYVGAQTTLPAGTLTVNCVAYSYSYYGDGTSKGLCYIKTESGEVLYGSGSATSKSGRNGAGGESKDDTKTITLEQDTPVEIVLISAAGYKQGVGIVDLTITYNTQSTEEPETQIPEDDPINTEIPNDNAAAIAVVIAMIIFGLIITTAVVFGAIFIRKRLKGGKK